MVYSKLYILTELNANDVRCIPIDRQKLDFLQDVYLWFRKSYIRRDTTQLYDHKMPLVWKRVKH